MELFSFSLFDKEPPSNVSKPKPIYIEPIVIPKFVKEENDIEILEKLKEATKEAFENAEPSDSEVADEVLSRLRALAKSREEKEKALKRKRELEKKKALARKRELEKKKALAQKRELEKKKALARKRELEKKKALARKRELEKKKALARKRELEKKKALVQKRELEKKKALALASKIEPKRVKNFLGEQKEIHTLSKEEEKTFHNLEVISVSKPFVLEDKPEIKSPKNEKGMQEEIELKKLPLVETLGVINVSEPFLEH